MATKREIRIETMNGLYLYEIYEKNDFSLEDVFTVNEASELYQKIIDNIDDIDKAIQNSLYNYSLSRLSYVDKAILRIATYELIYTDTPTNIIINEAVEITKKYADLDDERQHKFNNSVLDSIAKTRSK